MNRKRGSASSFLEELIGETKTSQRKLAELVGCSPQLLNSRLKKDTFSANDWLNAVWHLGYQVKLVQEEGVQATETKRRAVCPKFKKVVDGITYERSKALSLCHGWMAGGVRELYRDGQGRYFLLVQTCWPQMDATVMPCSTEEAADFYAQCAEDGDPPL